VNRRVVYIASLGHSGSTLLDLLLGGHPRFIGLGEIGDVIAPIGRDQPRNENPLCSCGQTAAECPFWSVVAHRIATAGEIPVARRYEIVFETFDEQFGCDAVPVDSSKYLPRLEMLHRDLKLDLRVLFLLKDVRAFTVSELDNRSRKRATGSDRRSIGPIGVFRRWHSHNHRMQEFFHRERLRVFQLGYEELCLSPEAIARKICRFLDEEYQPSMLSLRDSRSHVIRGNRMRSQPEKRALAYDNRWFHRRDWMLPALLFRQIMRYNREQVYSNGLEAMWER
jgi:hypothetical protein